MSFYIQSVEIGGPRPFYLLGPCSLEFPLIFKASYDKANRTSVTSFRGPRRAGKAAAFCRKSAGELKLPVVKTSHLFTRAASYFLIKKLAASPYGNHPSRKRIFPPKGLAFT